MKENCPFCQIAKGDDAARIIQENDRGFVIRDGFPISPGHSLIIPKRHIGSFFDLDAEVKRDLLHLLDEAKVALDIEYSPSSYNIGINDGVAAGQTIAHVHIHLIPRYTGDVADPRGGVRWIIRDKADYWSKK